MKRLQWIIPVLVIALIWLIAAFGFRKNQRISATLADGSTVELHRVTRGTNHVLDLRSRLQKLLRFAPQIIIPQKWKLTAPQQIINTGSNAIVLWIHSTGRSKALAVVITDTNGMGGSLSSPISFRPANAYTPVILTEWPRRAPEIGLTFLEGNPPERVLGRLIIPNPEITTAPSYARNLSGPSATNGSLELRLQSLDTLPNGEPFDTTAGRHWALRGRFQFFENGVASQDWKIQSLWLCDPGGNRRRATGPRSWTNGSFEIFGTPLWNDEPVWKLEADVIHAKNFQPTELVVFTNVPMPMPTGPADIEFHSNLFGMPITLHSMSKAMLTSPVFGRHSMGGPGFALEVDDRNPGWVPLIISIKNESGEAMRVPTHGFGDGYALIRCRAPEERWKRGRLKVTVTIQPRRRFVLLLELYSLN